MELSRRGLFKALGAGLTLSATGWSAQAGAVPGAAARGDAAGATGDALQLWYRAPATEWVQALPTGNGRLGAMVWGGVAHERIGLNEDTLYAGGPYDATSPEALAALPEVRALVFAGRYAEAEALADAKLLSRPAKQMPYQPLADLLLDFDRADHIDGYRRSLDLDTAVATTEFRSGGAWHRREVFVSEPDQCIVVRLSADLPGRVSLRLGVDSPQAGEVAADEGGLLFHGHNAGFAGIEGKLRFALRVQPRLRGGTLRVARDRLQVDPAQVAALEAESDELADRRRADAAAAVAGQHGGVGTVGAHQLGVRHQGVAVEDADGAGAEVVAGSRPVADDVGLLDGDLADVLLLLGGHEHVDGVGVGLLERAGGEARRERGNAGCDAG